ncbi:MAG: S41 family peptidase [Clostridiales bacterium]|nr:S41 family peptidase [Clostridiales bacterium]
MAFKFLIADNYIFTDALDQLYDNTIGEENVKGYRRNFDDVVISVVTEKIRSINQDRYTYLYTPEHYRLSKDMEKADAATARVEELTSETVYMLLPNISDDTKDFVLSNKQTLSKYKNLVLDLRSNYGGLLADFYKIAELFTKRGDVLGYEKFRMPLITHMVKSGGNGYFKFDKIIILQDENTASAAEGLILSLKGNSDNISTMGADTFGKGIGQITVPLLDGFAVKATVMLVAGPGDVSIHGVGIEPDIAYSGDDIIEAALDVIR